MSDNDNTGFKEKELSAEEWRERFEEASDFVRKYFEEAQSLEREVQYYSEFIRWKGLEGEYNLFREKAHEERLPDEPFPRLVL